MRAKPKTHKIYTNQRVLFCGFRRNGLLRENHTHTAERGVSDMDRGIVRTYAKQVDFCVVGKLRYMGKWDMHTRWFIDDAGNAYLVDDILKTIRIRPNKKSAANAADLI